MAGTVMTRSVNWKATIVLARSMRATGPCQSLSSLKSWAWLDAWDRQFEPIWGQITDQMAPPDSTPHSDLAIALTPGAKRRIIRTHCP
jgi:hypothetical protein